MEMKIIPVGGRVKSASVGLSHFYQNTDLPELDRNLTSLRKNPSLELLKAFFPSDRNRLKQLMQGIGFYRPVLKTDQGMGGNFLPFLIDTQTEKTILLQRKIIQEEGIAIPEAHTKVINGTIPQIQKDFLSFKLNEVVRQLSTLEASRKADKGRGSFFFIRPAITDKKIIFGRDIVAKVEKKVNTLLRRIERDANSQELFHSGKLRDTNLLYCQPDVFILSDGEIIIEKINCPDVGFFLNGISPLQSSILPKTQNIVKQLGEKVYARIEEAISQKDIAILTRDKVIENQEDVLELKEIECLKKGLEQRNIRVSVYPLSQVKSIPQGYPVILLNLDYNAQNIDKLFTTHCSGNINCFPNPFFQRACQATSGLQEIIIPPENQKQFLNLASSRPKNSKGLSLTLKQLDNILCKNNIQSDILQVDIGPEIVPIFTRSMHSWRQLPRRIARYKNINNIKIKKIPADFKNLLIDSNTGPRLHVYRFMFIN